jgi:hypothetical protein
MHVPKDFCYCDRTPAESSADGKEIYAASKAAVSEAIYRERQKIVTGVKKRTKRYLRFWALKADC